MNTDSLRYAGFWRRLIAHLMDVGILLPLFAFTFWGAPRYRLFFVYFLIPETLLGLVNIYLVRRFGGTPGKLIAGIRIRKVDGSPVGYREAILRDLPDLVLGLLASIALAYPLLHMSDGAYRALSSGDRSLRMADFAPAWYKPVDILQNVWVWGEFLVLFTNRKRRALHDFIAGTVVIYNSH